MEQLIWVVRDSAGKKAAVQLDCSHGIQDSLLACVHVAGENVVVLGCRSAHEDHEKWLHSFGHSVVAHSLLEHHCSVEGEGWQ